MTDVTNACRTMLMNIHTLQWDPDLCQYDTIHTHLYLYRHIRMYIVHCEVDHMQVLPVEYVHYYNAP